MSHEWRSTDVAPEGAVVMTKIDDEDAKVRAAIRKKAVLAEKANFRSA